MVRPVVLIACAFFLALSAFADVPGETVPDEPVLPETVAEQTVAPLPLIEVIELTLEQDPNIRIFESRLGSARAARMISSGRFDATLRATATAVDLEQPTGEDTSFEARETSETVALSWPLRSGQVLQPSVELNQDEGDPGVSTGTFAFSVRQPLLQGRRPSAVTADEEAAYVEVEASRLDLVHRIAERLLAATNQYWNVRAARFDVAVLREAEARSSELLDTTRRLVEADITPAAELIQLEADLVSRQANRIASERSLFVSFQNLVAIIGLEAAESALLGLPSDDFPTVDPEEVPPSARAYLAEAREERNDLAAARARLEAGELRLRSARDAVKPQLDLVLTPSYTGLVEDDGVGDAFEALTTNIPGVSANLLLSFAFPLPNRVARGALLRSEETVRQQALAVESQLIQIDANVQSAHDNVRSNAERVLVLERSVELFRKTLENEEKKLRVGSATLIDLINQTDRLTSAQQRLVSAKLTLAQALASLRFETGTLVRPAGDGVEAVRIRDLTTLPLRDP